MIPIFKSNYSIGKSILTLDDPSDTAEAPVEGGADSIISFCLENKISNLVLVEDDLIGFVKAVKVCEKHKINLIFGLRVPICNKLDDENCNSQHNIIIFAKNAKGYNAIRGISTFVKCHTKNTIDYLTLKSMWDADNLTLVVPFYDSFLHKNLLTFSNCLPDFSFAQPLFLVENNSLPIDPFIQKVVEFFCKTNSYQTLKAKTIYYKNRSDVFAYQAFKIATSRVSGGRPRSLYEPETGLMGSAEFCLESWKESQ
jgi:DNA polymerase III alpha subunit